MSPNERRVRRGFLRAAGEFVSELPFRIAGLFPKQRKGGHRADRKWTRPKRIAVFFTVLVVAGGGGASVLLVMKARDSAHLAWRLHDEAFEQFKAKRFDAAAAKYREILALNESDSRARYNLGASLMALGRRDEGMIEIRKAAAAQPDFDEKHVRLVEDAAVRGDEDVELAELRDRKSVG